MNLRMRRSACSNGDEAVESLINKQHQDMDLITALNRNAELESTTNSLRHSLELSRQREKKLAQKLEDMGCFSFDIEIQSVSMNPGVTSVEKFSYGTCPLEQERSFLSSLIERGGWLIGLLVFQSFSSIILSANENLLSNHPSIIFFLTMLVGAGGNAGNQAAVRVIRGIALGHLTDASKPYFLFRELMMAIALCGLLGATGLARTMLSQQTSLSEAFAIVISLMVIVFVSILTGAVLPLLLHYFKVDPAHSSTTIQVIMDISGVLLTCVVASNLLDTNLGKTFLKYLGLPA